MSEAGTIESLPGLVAFHHLGYATRDLAREREILEMLGYAAEGEQFTEPSLGVTGIFMAGAGPRIELLQKLPGSKVLDPWLDAGIKIFHTSYLVEDLDQAVTWARSRRAKVVEGPVLSRPLDGRLICFLMFPNRLMVELIEEDKSRERRGR